MLQSDKVPLEVLRNTAARFSMATQLASLRDSMATRISNTERPCLSLALLQVDKTPLELLKEQATQFATSTALWQLSPLLQSIPCLQKRKTVTPPQTLAKLTATPKALQYLKEQGRILTEYNALEWLSEYLQTPAPPLRTRPATLHTLEARPDILQAMQASVADVIEYDALYTILQRLQQQVERHKALKIQTEEAQRLNVQSLLFQMPFLKITDDFRTECENIVRGILEKASTEHLLLQGQETQQENTYADEGESVNDMSYMGM